jgi:membrane-associated protein
VNLGEQLLGGLTSYGIPLLCGITFISSAGAPLPVSLLLIAAGSFADHGDLNFSAVIVFATLSAVAGDFVGFSIGRWGDRRMARKVSVWLGSEERLQQAEEHARKWGGTGIFLTRWLLTPLGPFVNLVSGFADYPWIQFFFWAASGELLWVALYATLGRVFSHRVQELSAILGDASWALLALAFGAFIFWIIFRSANADPESSDGSPRQSRVQGDGGPVKTSPPVY